MPFSSILWTVIVVYLLRSDRLSTFIGHSSHPWGLSSLW
ncbi:hypothetical protein NARC_100083 [Candidatus Nitrosocosmicus arcticus]|uniref:Uncharacterized protein n=1 Tax=Candidatus Nitrosocosmicus arcticus TaxID=2035267 RepID=A0A557STT8_9ARCH|nr:hypothetical protein NARC_100083 [Candidatus Nitrosocosmicus arcticus]